MNTEIIDAGRDISGGCKMDVSRGTNVDRVSSEWFSRPDDERCLSLEELYASVKGRAERSRTRTVESAAIRVEAHRDNPEQLGLVLPGADQPVAPTHWSFGQLSSLVGAPAAYLRQLPAPLADINLQHGLTNHRAEQIKTMEVADGRAELRAVTGPDYGRIYDHELVSAVLAENIARRTLLSSITVRPLLDYNGAETGMYTIPAGGRRFRALELLVKQNPIFKDHRSPAFSAV